MRFLFLTLLPSFSLSLYLFVLGVVLARSLHRLPVIENRFTSPLILLFTLVEDFVKSRFDASRDIKGKWQEEST